MDGNAKDKRRNRRLPIDLQLEISHMYTPGNLQVCDLNEQIMVVDVSKAGLGFVAKSDLPLEFYFNAVLTIGASGERLQCVVQIIRKVTQNDGLWHYGCEFVGMAPVLGYIFEDYEEELSQTMKSEF